MTKTYASVQKQIDALQQEAKELRAAEITDVIARIRQAIDEYGLTAADLGLKIPKSRRRAAHGSAEVKYRDGEGNSWGGRGPRPRWLREALAAGKTLDDFAV